MLEGVLKASGTQLCEPYHTVSILGMLEGVLKVLPVFPPGRTLLVSILGMLEGVLKVGSSYETDLVFVFVSILGMLEGVLKAEECPLHSAHALQFQSLVCWRGC